MCLGEGQKTDSDPSQVLLNLEQMEESYSKLIENSTGLERLHGINPKRNLNFSCELVRKQNEFQKIMMLWQFWGECAQ